MDFHAEGAQGADSNRPRPLDLCDALGTHEHLLTDLDEALDLFVLDWTIQLPFQLAHTGLIDETVTLATRFAAITETQNFLPDCAIILAQGRSK